MPSYSSTSSLHLGLDLVRPLLMNAVTAPLERIQFFLQTQDEILLNLRQEPHPRRRPHHDQNPSQQHASCLDTWQEKHAQDKHSPVSRQEVVEEDEEEEEEEVRSIILAHAQLPYKDLPDCFHRLLNSSEGVPTFWHGHSLSVLRFILHTVVEQGILKSWIGMDQWTILGGGLNRLEHGSCGWFLGRVVSGVVVGSVAMVVQYPLALVQARMVTDVVRKTKVVHWRRKEVDVVGDAVVVEEPIKIQEIKEESEEGLVGDREVVEGFGEEDSKKVDEGEKKDGEDDGARMTSSVISMEDMPDQHLELEHESAAVPFITTTATTTTTMTAASTAASNQVASPKSKPVEYEYKYKYETVCDAIEHTFLSNNRNLLGFFNGLSAALVGKVISRVSYLAMFELLKPVLIRAGFRAGQGIGGGAAGRGGFVGAMVGLGAFTVVFGVSTFINMMVYPFETVSHRRMVAESGPVTKGGQEGERKEEAGERYSSSWDAAQKLVARQGVQGLYGGFEAAMVRGVGMVVMSLVF